MNRQHVLIGFLIVALTLAVVPHPLPAQAATPARPAAYFDGDRYDDLVIGVPYEGVEDAANAGLVHALYGAAGGGLSADGSQVWHQDLPGVLETSEAGDEFGFALAVADFDGDSFLDLAVGVHGDAVGFIPTAGTVHVFYGTAAGLSANRNQLWHQASPGIEDDVEADDRFGWSLTAGDFDGDGYGDLAVGVLWEDVGTPLVENAGAVHVIYGSPDGLTAVGNQVWYEGQNSVLGSPMANDQFGQALGVGDFDGDGHDDLVIGTPLNDLSGWADSGTVHILYGSDDGLTANWDSRWHQGYAGLADTYETGDRFGQALATGDMNCDGYDDLAVGVPYEDVGIPAVENAGAVHLIYGSATGLTVAGNWLHYEPSAGPVAPEPHDNLGWSLASGDFDGNGFTDVAAGMPGEENDEAKNNAGAVQIVYFSHTPVVIQLWDQDDTGVQDVAEAGDGFGTSLAVGDLDGDGYADLAVGVPWEDIFDPVVVNAGAVHVLYGSPAGIQGGDDAFLHQGIDGIDGDPEPEDRLGLALAALPTVRHRIYLPVVQRGS
ncbi:MAG: FG-GAP repeat protein [Anaerolineae bacterium]|nr:FG-GAP repeat protein [Anaerolineae bacterium]